MSYTWKCLSSLLVLRRDLVFLVTKIRQYSTMSSGYILYSGPLWVIYVSLFSSCGYTIREKGSLSRIELRVVLAKRFVNNRSKRFAFTYTYVLSLRHLLVFLEGSWWIFLCSMVVYWYIYIWRIGCYGRGYIIWVKLYAYTVYQYIWNMFANNIIRHDRIDVYV